ncbi:hypothetical protein LMH73_002520 [Vibrio splendidus]|nr:hypothetical protein [Vibrio splendidus]MCC4880457.1 hypothetical protein [Vibrio splendidus]
MAKVILTKQQNDEVKSFIVNAECESGDEQALIAAWSKSHSENESVKHVCDNINAKIERLTDEQKLGFALMACTETYVSEFPELEYLSIPDEIHELEDFELQVWLLSDDVIFGYKINPIKLKELLSSHSDFSGI